MVSGSMKENLQRESVGNPPVIDGERIASCCVCCGSRDLESSAAVLMPFIAHRVFNWAPVFIDESWGLRTLKTGLAYSICNTLRCRNCSLLFLDLRFSDAELSRLYQDYRGEAYNALREHYEPGWLQRCRFYDKPVAYLPQIEAFLEPHLNGAIRVLDWGGDSGSNTPFQGRCECCDIYDISGKPVVPGARQVGLDEAQSNDYSLIVCSNVLEHVSQPAALLAEIRQAMRPQTLLYLEVPHETLMREQSSPPAAAKRHWHEHVNFFSTDSLRALLQACRLELLEMRSIEADAGASGAHQLQIACRLA